MQRLTGIAFWTTDDGPLGTGFFELGQLTVLTGVNDSGKTLLLGLIDRALGHPGTVGGVDVFAIADAGRARALIDRGYLDAVEPDDWSEALAGSPLLEQLELPGLDGQTRIAVRVHASSPFEAWRWGRAPAELPAQTRAAVKELDLPLRVDSDDAPLQTELLGAASPALLPEPVLLPVSDEQLRQRVQEAVVGLCEALRLLGFNMRNLKATPGEFGEVDDRWSIVYGVDWRDERPAFASMLIDQGEREQLIAIHPAARQAAAAVQRIARHLLPEFISERYQLRVGPASVTAIASGRRAVDIRLIALPTSEEEEQAFEHDDSFTLTEAGSGYALWLQLALMEAAGRVKTLARLLLDAQRQLDYPDPASEFEFWPLDLDTMQSVPVTPPPEIYADAISAERDHALEQARRLITDTLTQLAEPETRAPEPAIPIPPLGHPDSEPHGQIPPAGWLSDYRPRLYLIDEPEQRLHPALARRAAGWLAAATEQWGVQCLIATHAPAFMDLPGDLRLYQLTREQDRTTIDRLNLAELTPSSQFATAMGFDRGDLLSRWSAFLVVDDPDVAAILQELAPERMRHSRIRLLLIADHANHPASDLALLTTFTTAPIVALTLPGHDQPAHDSGVHQVALAARSARDLLDRSMLAFAAAPDDQLVRTAAHLMHLDQQPLPDPLADALWTVEQIILEHEHQPDRH